jgi:glycosyltransferase involved in cell wall biosynthesis
MASEGDVGPIAIVVPVYNGAQFLPLTLQSVFAQTRSDWRLVVVDDGSTDETPTVARRYLDGEPRARLVQQPNGGLPAARNRGFAEIDADCRSVLFLDADDVLRPDAVRVLAAALAADASAPAAHGVATHIDKEGAPFLPGEAERHSRSRRVLEGHRVVDWHVSQPTTFAVLAFHFVISTPGQALIRCEALKRIGLYDKRLAGAADWDLWLRLARLGDIAFVDQVVLEYRRHGSNMSGDFRLMRHDEIMVRRKLIASPENTPEQRRIAKLCWRHKERLNAGVYRRLVVTAIRNGKPGSAVKWLGHTTEAYLHWLCGATAVSWVDLRKPQSPGGGRA